MIHVFKNFPFQDIYPIFNFWVSPLWLLTLHACGSHHETAQMTDVLVCIYIAGWTLLVITIIIRPI